MMNLKKNKGVILFVGIVVSVAISAFFLNELDKYLVQREINEQKEFFTNTNKLICYQTAFDTKYLISKEKGWYLYGDNYVTNGEKVYKLTDCTIGG